VRVRVRGIEPPRPEWTTKFFAKKTFRCDQANTIHAVLKEATKRADACQEPQGCTPLRPSVWPTAVPNCLAYRVPNRVPTKKTAFPVAPFGGPKRRYSRVRTRGFEPPPSQLRTRSLVWRVCQFRHVRSLLQHAQEFRQKRPFSQRPFRCPLSFSIPRFCWTTALLLCSKAQANNLGRLNKQHGQTLSNSGFPALKTHSPQPAFIVQLLLPAGRFCPSKRFNRQDCYT
jgi:hypothetical protein